MTEEKINYEVGDMLEMYKINSGGHRAKFSIAIQGIHSIEQLNKKNASYRFIEDCKLQENDFEYTTINQTIVIDCEYDSFKRFYNHAKKKAFSITMSEGEE